MRKKAEWCPNNGCGMINGAAPIVHFTCGYCQSMCSGTKKYCEHCKKCGSCGRVIKKFYYTKIKKYRSIDDE
jgi:hypothetical protein